MTTVMRAQKPSQTMIAELVTEYESGKLSRRALIAALAVLVGGSAAASSVGAKTAHPLPRHTPSPLRTGLCEVLHIDTPIIQASLGPWSTPELTAAVSRTGAIGSLGTVLRSPEEIRSQIRRIRELTDRPFIVNFSRRPFNEEGFAVALAERVPVISLAHGDPGELPRRAHDAGLRFLHMVHTVSQARQAAESGVDAVIAQGTEAGGFGGEVTTLCLVPQVVEAITPIPVVAAGGIADGRGFAVALLLGAQGINIGTRFVASAEAGVRDSWKRQIVDAQSEETVRLTFADAIIPSAPRSYEGLSPRVLRTPFVEQWNPDPAGAAAESSRLGPMIVAAAREGRADEFIPFTGQTAGLINDILAVEEIVRRIANDATRLLQEAPQLTRS